MTVAENTDKVRRETPVILRILKLHRIAPTVFYTLLILLIAEFAVIFVAPSVVPDHDYLSIYLSEKAIQNAEQFARGEDEFMLFDESTGWRNRPNSGKGEWVLDRFGSRSTHEISREKSDKQRLMFLGNSLINGGTHVSNEETISALLEDSTTEALNFGTMLYSLDQMYLAYSRHYARFDPDVVVVGISDDPGDGLDNMYVPFRRRAEANMPYMKPRFELVDGNLEAIPMPPLEAYANTLRNSDMIDYLEKHDAHIANFEKFKRFELLPISGILRQAFRKIESFRRLSRENRQNLELVTSVLKRLQSEVERDGARLIVLMVPSSEVVFPGSIRSRFPDQYGNLVEKLTDEGFEIVDPRPAFRESGLAPYQIYYADALHYDPRGNQILADELRVRVGNISK